MFADDITVFFAAKNLSEGTVTPQNITNRTAEWLDNRRLTINVNKCSSRLLVLNIKEMLL